VQEDELLSYGVTVDWLEDVFKDDEDSILELAELLPQEAAEALLELAVGVKPQVAAPIAENDDPFAHPDAQRRFRVMNNIEELEQALEYPWEKWVIFLHPSQKEFVERDYSGPARVSGSAGTGKTIVALHRAVFLARNNPEARVLLSTFSDTLANALQTKLRRLISNEPRMGERLEVQAMNDIGQRLYTAHYGRAKIAPRDEVQALIKSSSSEVEGHRFTLNFLMTEWQQVVDAWQLDTWEAYRDVKRLGRKTRLPENQRAILWRIFEGVRSKLKEKGWVTYADMFSQLAAKVTEAKHKPFDYVIIDEAQDINVAQLRFLAALGANTPNALFFAGDLGQRIFQQPFSWRSLGVDIRGRSRTLRINYRTSHQIRMQADRLLGPEVSDVDGNTEERRGTVSVFNGPKPTISVLDSVDEEINAVSQWLSERTKEGLMPHEIGVFVRSDHEVERAQAAVESAGLPMKVLDEHVATASGYVSVSTMHLAKGLEFRAVVVMACDDEVIPSQDRIEAIADNADLEDVYNTERHLLYVACTRARDHLLVTSVDPSSEFLDDLQV
ncbi:MAG: UvrD-helicase domain-containing protein, partial [Mariprofundaceae bacterium]